jgi:antitoxin PrlF
MTHDDDWALAPFLDLLERDISSHPERSSGIPVSLFDRWMEVTDGIEFDLEDAIEGPVAL